MILQLICVNHSLICFLLIFQENVPIIATLCNPGMRDRHWDQMGAKIGFSITPDSGTTLRKMLRHNLVPFMEELEVISGAASKVGSILVVALADLTYLD